MMGLLIRIGEPRGTWLVRLAKDGLGDGMTGGGRSRVRSGIRGLCSDGEEPGEKA